MRRAENNPNPDRAERLHIQSQGISFAAAERVLSDFTQAQANGADFGTAIWTLSRQLRRELDYDLQAVQADSEGRYSGRAADPVYNRRLGLSEGHLEEVVTLFDDRPGSGTRGLNRPSASRLIFSGTRVAASTGWGSRSISAQTSPTASWTQTKEPERLLVEADGVGRSPMTSKTPRDHRLRESGGSRALRRVERIWRRRTALVDVGGRTMAATSAELLFKHNALEIELEAMDLTRRSTRRR